MVKCNSNRQKNKQTRDLDSLDRLGGVVGDVNVDADGLSVIVQLLAIHRGRERHSLVNRIKFRTKHTHTHTVFPYLFISLVEQSIYFLPSSHDTLHVLCA